jgi:hypothetical protein
VGAKVGENIYLISQSTQQFFNDKINTIVSTFVFYVSVMLYRYMKLCIIIVDQVSHTVEKAFRSV